MATREFSNTIRLACAIFCSSFFAFAVSLCECQRMIHFSSNCDRGAALDWKSIHFQHRKFKRFICSCCPWMQILRYLEMAKKCVYSRRHIPFRRVTHWIFCGIYNNMVTFIHNFPLCIRYIFRDPVIPQFIRKTIHPKVQKWRKYFALCCN